MFDSPTSDPHFFPFPLSRYPTQSFSFGHTNTSVWWRSRRLSRLPYELVQGFLFSLPFVFFPRDIIPPHFFWVLTFLGVVVLTFLPLFFAATPPN